VPLVISADLGTTTIAALAVDTERGELVQSVTLENDAEVTSADEKRRGGSDWDAARIAEIAMRCLGEVVTRLGDRSREVVAIGLTGQQHGVLFADGGEPLTPLVNWQDRRALQPMDGGESTFLDEARRRVGESCERAGCRLAAGFVATTMFRWRCEGVLPNRGIACCLPDWFAGQLTDATVRSEPTMAAGAGVLDVARRDWDGAAVQSLGLSLEQFPSVVEADQPLGGLCAPVATRLGLPAGLPVFPAIGDNQASFVGSVNKTAATLAINVGTGGQVGCYSDAFCYSPLLETRPFPLAGYLLVSCGLCGGRSYALLERFFRQLGRELFGLEKSEPLYEAMNRLAESAAGGADGLTCDPLFTGTRAQPERRAEWTGVTPENFTPANWIRSLLDGMAGVFAAGFDEMRRVGSAGEFDQIVGAGNGLRKNLVLAQAIAERFRLPVRLPAHSEEAATGAAVVAAVGAGLHESLADAAQWMRYGELACPAAP
jgi:sugar (pentulose or hexulose) kinase